MRKTMRIEALTAQECRTLDERLARWTADRQMEGKLPPDWELRAQLPKLAKEFKDGRGEARPLFTPEEQRDVDASRAAVALRDRIDGGEDHGPALSHLATQNMIANGLSGLDARKAITERFSALYGREVSDYVREQRRGAATVRDSEGQERLFPKELGWERYEPAFRRYAAHSAMLFVAQRDGALTRKEYQQGMKYGERWFAEQQRQGKLPNRDEIRACGQPLQVLLLPYQKECGRRESRRMGGADGAYWRQADELAGYLKQDIDAERRYTRTLDDYAVKNAPSYGRPVDQMKRDIEERFTLRTLYTPAEYLESCLERDRQQSGEKNRHAPDRQTSRRQDRNRDRDGGRDM
ncbi:MAG: hypothetical protein ACFCUQ_18060 [Kiloniellales bacterium]